VQNNRMAVVGIGATGTVLAGALLSKYPETFLIGRKPDLGKTLNSRGIHVSGEIAYYPRADYPAAPSKKVGILPTSGQVDFQVEAMIGYRIRSWKYIAGEQMLPYVFEGEKSGWSNTQTITILDPSVPSPSPSSTSFSPDSSLMIASIAVSVAVVCIVSLVYFKKLRSEAKPS